jgi:imidazolonepropionase-like amidohydrolase
MDIMEFHVCQQGRDMRWVVRLDNATYGAYLDKEQALLDAVEAARDARQAGREARVFLQERAEAARVF